MAADAIAVAKEALKPSRSDEEDERASLFSSYIGLSFALFLGLLPKSSAAYVSSLQSRNRILAMKLFEAEDQLRQLRSRRKEDAKANARVTEIYAGHRTRWQQEEKRLLQRIDAADEEAASLRARIKETERAEAELRAAVERLEKEVAERDEMLDFMARKVEGDGFSEKGVMGADGGLEPMDHGELDREFSGVRVSGALEPVLEERFLARNGEFEGMADLFAHQNNYVKEFLMPPVDMKLWMDRSAGWQDMQYDSLESTHNMKHLVARRESPWKVDGESSGVSSKLKLLEQELVNLEKLGKEDPSKILSLMRKQSKRYQSLAGKIDDLCRKMRLNDPCDPTLSPEFRTQRQTEFLLEAFRLQHTASETRQKLSTLQAEATKSYLGDDLTVKDKLNTRRSLDSIRNNFKEIQRNLEIWLARIMGDLEGILARDGASRVRDYYSSPFPFGR
ncbi:uncharacterized protein LOC103975244 [Musa acuminata AAA Group]|uniref:(wild Malaysian banana) hypothetical protein n=1 Tax=Musa acuminata subsp. malaccensis TaxID=214687 RepID=A0A804I4M1_MUSAM|nr:PREDICTED: uncharacterized protein LOC103975244 [Musa acuminata subsp. malaccensis]CAG1862551.1 unnamed protein product [Musa acuminata subsp. malaccensis]